jgi:malate dehydrogenase (oxaloacetate-decarboxylating)(NADP+)
VIGKKPGSDTYAAMNILLLDKQTVALVDTHVNDNPTAEQIAEFTIAAAEEMTLLHMKPKVALLSRSNFGSGSSASGSKMRQALELIRHARQDWKWTAKCTATARWTKRCAWTSCRCHA